MNEASDSELETWLQQCLPSELVFDFDAETIDTAAEDGDEYWDVPSLEEHMQTGTDDTTSTGGSDTLSLDIDSEKARGNTTVRQQKKRRRRQQEELVYLRARVMEMEAELKRLREQTIVKNSSGLNLLWGGQHASTRSLAVQNDVQDWADAATQEKVQVQRALLEHVKLRAMLEHQIAMGKNLDRILRKRPRFAALADTYLGTGPSMATLEDDQFFERIGRNLDQQYAQADQVLRASAQYFQHRAAQTKIEVVMRADASGVYLEYAQFRTFPFPWQTWSRTIWEMLSQRTMHYGTGVLVNRSITEDCIQCKLVDSFRRTKTARETVSVLRVVVKRFLETERNVTVWEAHIETAGSVSVRVRGNAWLELREGQSSEECKFQFCGRFVPEMSEAGWDGGVEIGTLTELIVDMCPRIVSMLQNTVFEMLLERTAQH